MKTNINTNRLLDIQQVASYLDVSVHTLYKMVSQQRIHDIKIGRLVKFDHIKLGDWIKQRTVMPMPERKGSPYE